MEARLWILFIAAVLALGGCRPKPTPRMQGSATVRESSAPSSAPPGAKPVPTLPGCAQSFALFDVNGDQRVSREEFLDPPHAHPDPSGLFLERDADVDGSLTMSEFCSGWGVFAGPGRGSALGPVTARGTGRGRGSGGARKGGLHCQARFSRFDTNGDGDVDERELAALPHPCGDAAAIFTARDQNHDGLITRAEFCAPWGLGSENSNASAP